MHEIDNFSFTIPMHCLAGDHYRSSIWMQQALRKWNEEEDNKSVEKAEILEYLAFSLYAQGNMRRALREDEKFLDDTKFMRLFRLECTG